VLKNGRFNFARIGLVVMLAHGINDPIYSGLDQFGEFQN